MFLSVVTGFAAGAVHVVSGADHMVAMAPSSIRRPRLALINGLAWGIGHSAGVLMLSILGILAKDIINIQKMSHYAEFIVGISLLIVGALAIRTSLKVNIHMHQHMHGKETPHKHFHFHSPGNEIHKSRHTHTATGLGVLHGFAGASHLVAVIPALALPLLGALAYLFAYLLGSVFAMGCVVLGISFATSKANKKFYPFLMRSVGSLSIMTGIFWLQRTLILNF
tara:strand:- start:232 stop:903 length:672 start_codon:yes stop_codon:yes gene_type:complete